MSAEVPKFASFRKLNGSKSQSQVSSNHVAGTGSKRKRNDKTTLSSRSTSASLKQNELPLNISDRKSSSSFFIDRQGDSGFRSYGRNDPSKVPVYRSKEDLRILGNSHVFKQSLSGQNPLSNISSLEYQALLKEPLASPLKDVEGFPNDSADRSGAEEFISLWPISKNTPGQTDQDREPSQQSLSPRSSPRAEVSEESFQPKDKATKIEHDAKDLQRENMRLRKKTKGYPNEVTGWLELIRFQDVWIQRGMSNNNQDDERPDNTLVARIKLSVISEAFESIQEDNIDASLLAMEWIETGSKIWDLTTLSCEWEKAIKRYNYCEVLWRKYLNFKQTQPTNFSFKDCKVAFERYFESLRSRTVDSMHLLQAFLRLTTFIWQVGYYEYAVALWQAILEIRFFTSPNLQSSDHGVLFRAFEDFWDSEVPRIGEYGSNGWSNKPDAHWQRNLTRSRHDSSATGVLCHTAEDTKAQQAFYPCRMSETLEQDDPYSVILAEDLLPFLNLGFIELEPSHLIDAFLVFFSLPQLSNTQSIASMLDERESLPLFNFGQAILSQDEGKRVYDDLLERNIYKCLMTQDTLFAMSGPFQRFSPWTFPQRSATKGIRQQFISQTLELLGNALPYNTDLTSYRIAFEATFALDRARQLTKRMIKRDPESIRLYATFAFIEYQMNGIQKSEQFLLTTIDAFHKMLSNRKQSTIELWRALIWFALGECDEDKVKRCLAAIVVKDTAPVRDKTWNLDDLSISSVQNVLLDEHNKFIQRQDWHQVLRCVECLAIARYVMTNNIQLILEHFDLQFKLFDQNIDPRFLESLHQTQAEMIVYHKASHRPYEPQAVRQALRRSGAIFPFNTLFPSLEVDIGQSSLLMLKDHLLPPSHTFTSTKAAIFLSDVCSLTMQITHNSISTIHSVRNKFERAVQNELGRNNPAIWIAYLLHEHKQGHMKDAKAIFFRGLANVPWVREFALLAFSHLSEVVNQSELQSLHSLVSERGLHIHVNTISNLMSPELPRFES